MLAAAALRCVGGQLQGRLILDTKDKRDRALRMGIKDPNKVYRVDELAGGDVILSATGVTEGNLLDGVHFGKHVITTDTVVMRSSSGTVRWIKGKHTLLEKFHLD